MSSVCRFGYVILALICLQNKGIRASQSQRFPREDYVDANDVLKFLEDIYDNSRDVGTQNDNRGVWEDADGHMSPRLHEDEFSRLLAYGEDPKRNDMDYELYNAMQFLDDGETDEENQNFLSETQPSKITKTWNDVLRSDEMRQRLLMTAYLEDLLDNQEAAKNADWSEDSLRELVRKEEDTDSNNRNAKYEQNDDKNDKSSNGMSNLEDTVTSDGKKERGGKSENADVGTSESKHADQENNNHEQAKEVALKKNDEDVQEEKLPYSQNDVDELRALLTEMIDENTSEMSDDNFNAKTLSNSTTVNINVNIPGISVTQDDTYLCTAAKIPVDENSTEPLYIVEYIPHAKQAVAHHMLMYGCEGPGRTDALVWNCGGPMAEQKKDTGAFKHGPLCESPSGQETILWAWAKDAPQFKLPKDVGFKVGPGTNIQYLVLQVHYKSADVFKGGMKDHSGVSVIATKTRKPRLAGVYIMASALGEIDPHKRENFDIICEYEQNFVMHPFAFRTHTHALGVEVLGFRIRDEEWTLIGAKNPQAPEAFYPVARKNMTIRYDDLLAARCLMSNFRNVPTRIGFRHTDEMCNFYIMFWVESQYEQALDSWSKACGNGFPWVHWSDLPGYYN